VVACEEASDKLALEEHKQWVLENCSEIGSEDFYGYDFHRLD
jgi:hypothetical protein